MSLFKVNVLFPFYRQKKEERMKKLMEKLSADAKDSVARMIEKHSQEMLLMIAKRMSESESQVSLQFCSICSFVHALLRSHCCS